MEKKYNYFYKITNNINNHYYYGIHSTDNLNDGYMGSGTRLHYAYKKYGMENFTKEILQYFDTREKCAQYESDVVTESLVLDTNCYNISCGGEGWNTISSVSCITNDGKKCRIDKNTFYKNKYKTYTSGKKAVYDKILNKNILVDINDTRESVNHNMTTFLNIKTNKYERKNILDNFDRNIYKGIPYKHISVKDKNNNYYSVSINDTRYLSGELKPIWSGRTHTKETIQKLKDTYKKINHQQGEKNSQYNTIWIYKLNNDNCTYTNKKIKKEILSLYLNDNWFIGRRTKTKEFYDVKENKKITDIHWYHKIINGQKITKKLHDSDELLKDNTWLKGR